jgi:hypothetical protein
LFEVKNILIVTALFHKNGRMECWNAGILGVRGDVIMEYWNDGILE